MLFNKRIFTFSVTLASLLLVTTVIVPWGIGQFLHRSLPKQIELFNKHFPDWEYTIQTYQPGIFESEMVATLSARNTADPKIPFFKLQIENKISHGPICFDFKNKSIQFCLAKISHQIKPGKESLVQFDQSVFPVDSVVKYSGIIEMHWYCDKISGKVDLLNNKSLKFELDNLVYKAHCNLDGVYPTYQLSVREFGVYDKNSQAIYKIRGGFINNVSKNNQDLSGSSHIVLDVMELGPPGNQYQLEGFDLENETNIVLDKYNFRINPKVKKITVNNVVYGPFQADFIINKVPVQLIKDIQAIQGAKTIQRPISNGIEEGRTIGNLILKSELDIEFILKNIKLQMPDGELLLSGGGNFISKRDQNAMNYGGSNAKGMLSISKQALHNMLPTMVPSSAGPGSMFNGYLIDSGKDWESYLVYKNNKFYINGSALLDETSRDFSPFMRPFTPTQELMIAIWLDDLEKVKRILSSSNMNVNFIQTDRKNPIQAAALMGNRDIVRLLLEYKVPVNQADYIGNTALYWAARSGHLGIVQDLLNQSANPNLGNHNGWTPLQEAAENGHVEIVKLLLQQKNIDVNQADKEGRTPLFWAAKNGQEEIVRLLLEKGGDPNIANIRGIKPIDIAREYKQVGTVYLLKN